jgi:hypothetical protein
LQVRKICRYLSEIFTKSRRDAGGLAAGVARIAGNAGAAGWIAARAGR